MADITIESIDARAAVGVRGHTTMATIGDDIGRMAQRVAEAAGERAAGPVCARYHTWGDTESGPGGEIELLVPVAGEPFTDGDVGPSELPACRAAVVWHEGPYEGLHATWMAIHAWMAAEGLEAGLPPWEEYVSDCTVTPAADLRTKIVCPIAGADSPTP